MRCLFTPPPSTAVPDAVLGSGIRPPWMAALAQSLCFAAPAHPCAMAGMQKDCRNNPCPGVVSLPLFKGESALGREGARTPPLA